jgi:hypothetical protein
VQPEGLGEFKKKLNGLSGSLTLDLPTCSLKLLITLVKTLKSNADDGELGTVLNGKGHALI